MVARLLSLSLGIASAWSAGPRIPVPEIEVNLDLAPEERFTKVVQHFNEPLNNFAKHLHAGNFLVRALAKQVANHRGAENDELAAEIRGIAKVSGIAEPEIHAMQLLYELNSLMIPLTNLTGAFDFDRVSRVMEAADEEAKSSYSGSFPITFGCTGIIAHDDDDGTVYHARNLDFSFANFLQPMTYTGIFTKGGNEVFRAQTIAGYASILTGMRKGPNGFTVEINTRFTDHFGGNKEMFHNVFSEKRDPSGWTKRKILENHDNYEDAVEAFSNTPYGATEYNIVAGVGKGTILARNPDGLAYQLPLSESSKKYIIMTNFDYVYHDLKEKFDPTGGKGIFHPRRPAAEKILDAAEVITPELLFNVINDYTVMAKDTIFQVIMNVETGLWNASLPACTKCGRDSQVMV